jgi:hypothetical protein
MVAICTGDGSWKYSLKYSPLQKTLAGVGGRRGKGEAYIITPDMTPWSYPKRKTPNDTKIEVK